MAQQKTVMQTEERQSSFDLVTLLDLIALAMVDEDDEKKSADDKEARFSGTKN